MFNQVKYHYRIILILFNILGEDGGFSWQVKSMESESSESDTSIMLSFPLNSKRPSSFVVSYKTIITWFVYPE